MVCSYCSYFLKLSVELVYCQEKGCTLRLHHVCQVDYMAMHEIDLEEVERNIYHICVDKLQKEASLIN